jgi:hypothetical protein
MGLKPRRLTLGKGPMASVASRRGAEDAAECQAMPPPRCPVGHLAGDGG